MRITTASASALILCVLGQSVSADGPDLALGKNVIPGEPPAVTRANVEDFVDRMVSAYLRDSHTAGATVSVVDRNGSLLEKGYGIATLNPQRPVDPARSLFCFGSISKTFAALAAMQLAAAGKLDMDADINRYLPANLQVPDAGFPPVKVRDLLTHSAGFEDSVLGDTIYAPEAVVPTLDNYLARYRPKRVRAPGLRAVYGNYASGLLGSIVAHVSGNSYESYIDTHILMPLGMRHTTFREFLPAQDPRNLTGALREDLSPGFIYSNGAFTEAPLEHLAQASPFDGGRSTAADMARYIRFWLSNGTLDGSELLSESDFTAMTSINFRNIPEDGAEAIAHGLFRKRYGRYLSLEKGGDTLFFRANMVVLPEAGLGVFVAVNTDGTNNGLPDLMPKLLFEHFFPNARPPIVMPAAIAGGAQLKRYVGLYRDERRNYSTFEKLLARLIGFVNEVKVAIAVDGNLSIDKLQLTQTGPLSFTVYKPDEEAGEIWHFFEDKQGRIVSLSPGNREAAYYDRVGFVDNVDTLRFILRTAVLMSLLLLIGCSWRLLRNRKKPASAASYRMNLVAMTSAILWLAFFVAFLGAASAVDNDWTNLMAGRYPSLALMIAIALAYVAAAATVLLNGLLAWRWSSLDWTLDRKLRLSVASLTMLAAVALLVRWNMIGAPVML